MKTYSIFMFFLLFSTFNAWGEMMPRSRDSLDFQPRDTIMAFDGVDIQEYDEIVLPPVSADSIQVMVSEIRKMKRKEQQSTARHFPWKDVLACMREGNVFHFKYDRCDCGSELVGVMFSSPKWTWEALCGVAGMLYICPECKMQTGFECSIMN